jgi:hypothetical protein
MIEEGERNWRQEIRQDPAVFSVIDFDHEHKLQWNVARPKRFELLTF